MSQFDDYVGGDHPSSSNFRRIIVNEKPISKKAVFEDINGKYQVELQNAI